MIKFGIWLDDGLGNSKQFVEEAIVAEKCGFDFAWIGDHTIWYDTTYKIPELFTLLAAIGEKTKKIKLSSCVADPHRRHPVILAQIIATLDELTDGRAALGLGAGEGGLQLNPFGIKWDNPFATLKESIIAIRKLWKATPSDPANFNGKIFNLQNAFMQIKPFKERSPPIYVGALSPKTRILTGEIADGWVPWISTPETFESNLKEILEGTKKAGRSLDELDLVASLYTAISDDQEKAFEAIDPYVREAIILDRDLRNRLGIAILEDNLSLQQIKPTAGSADNLRKAAQVIPRKVIESSSAYGTVNKIIEKIETFIEKGATHVNIFNLGPDNKKTMNFFKNQIIPYFKSEK